MGMRCSPTGSIFLEDVQVPADRLLGDPDESGKRSAVETLLGERAALTGMALAIVEESLALALAYAKERRQFGQPIAQFQAVQLTLARMYAAQEGIRALLDRGRLLVAAGEASLQYFCAAKYTSSTLATQAALDAVQVLGGNGYTAEYRVEGLARDAKLLEIGGGTSDIQLLAVARELLKS
jgi:alkylation response protein AidB-like acyl-CoA dehydrogenase